MRKPDFCIYENKDEIDQRLCFRYTDSTIPVLHKSEISMLEPSSVAVQTCLCRNPRRPVFSQRGSYVIYFFLMGVIAFCTCLRNLLTYLNVL